MPSGPTGPPIRGQEVRYRIERAGSGYRVVGDHLLIWEPTLGEAAERRDELLSVGWRRSLEARPRASACGPFDRVVYGPVLSRRLGRSLGINLTPLGRSVCTFSCVYCEFSHKLRQRHGGRWPTPRGVAAALEAALHETGPLDSITLSGHGEPTLHPRFPAIVEALLEVAHRERPGTPVRILTNGSGAFRPEIRRALDALDERIVKLDADPEVVNQPAKTVRPGALVSGIARLRDLTLQSCFVDGAITNLDREGIEEWIGVVAELRPRRVQLYTIDREPAAFDVRPVAKAQLEEIAGWLLARTGLAAEVFA